MQASQSSDVGDVAVLPQRRSGRTGLNLRGLATYADRVNSDSDGEGGSAFARPRDPVSRQPSAVPSLPGRDYSGSASPPKAASQTLPYRKGLQVPQTAAQNMPQRRSETPQADIPDDDSLAGIPDSPPEFPDSWMEM